MKDLFNILPCVFGIIMINRLYDRIQCYRCYKTKCQPIICISMPCVRLDCFIRKISSRIRIHIRLSSNFPQLHMPFGETKRRNLSYLYDICKRTSYTCKLEMVYFTHTHTNTSTTTFSGMYLLRNTFTTIKRHQVQ